MAGQQNEKMQSFAAMSIWLFCSVGMMVFNKLAVGVFPATVSLVGLQMVFTVVVLVACCWRNLHIGSSTDLFRWMRVAPMFAGVLLTSMLALKQAPMSLVVVFRCLAPLFALCVERFYPNPLVITAPMVHAILVMLVGALIYVKDLEIKGSVATGIGWVLLNNVFAVADRLLQRMMLGKDQCPVDISQPTCTILNNLFGLVPLLAIVVSNGELSTVPGLLAGMSKAGMLWLSLSCMVGVLIAYTGVWLQSLISATSFLVLATSGKFVVILMEVAFFSGAHSKALTVSQYFGACLTICGGVAYGKVREHLEVTTKPTPATKPDEERQPLVPRQPRNSDENA